MRCIVCFFFLLSGCSLLDTVTETGDTYVRVKQLEAKRSFLETQEKLVGKLQEYQQKLIVAETKKDERTAKKKMRKVRKKIEQHREECIRIHRRHGRDRIICTEK